MVKVTITVNRELVQPGATVVFYKECDCEAIVASTRCRFIEWESPDLIAIVVDEQGDTVRMSFGCMDVGADIYITGDWKMCRPEDFEGHQSQAPRCVCRGVRH